MHPACVIRLRWRRKKCGRDARGPREKGKKMNVQSCKAGQALN
jgi:hypothetical protein